MFVYFLLKALIMSVYLLLSLLAVVQVCSATEYYVRPTEPTVTTCPGQPCLTLNEYTNNTDHYIKSNAVLTFLPGKHHMDRPIEIRDVHNLTLKSTGNENIQPQLVPQFSCEIHGRCLDINYTITARNRIANSRSEPRSVPVCCSAVHLINVSYIHIDGICVTVNSTDISGLTFEQCTEVRISNTVLTINSNEMHTSEFGFLAHKSRNILVDSLQASNFSWGMALYKSITIDVSNTKIQKSHKSGMLIFESDNITLVNMTSSQNNEHGILSEAMRHAVMENVTTEYNLLQGIVLETCSNISMALVLSNHNHISGIAIFTSTETIITNTSSVGNNGSGIQMFQSNNTRILLLSSMYNGKRGLIETECVNTTLSNCHFVQNKGSDILLVSSRDFNLTGTAAYLTAHTSNSIHLEDIIFSGMSSPSTINNTIDPTSLPAIVELYNSNATVCNCSIIRNTISFIKAIGSGVTFSGELTFSHNRAVTGTALIFARSSTLILTENCNALFIENEVSHYGGVIYINTEESYVRSMTLNDATLDYRNVGSLTTSRTACFIRVEGSRSWSDTRLVFVNNTAGKGGDVLYGGLVALGWDGDWNCLLSFKNISDMSQQSGLSTIISSVLL